MFPAVTARTKIIIVNSNCLWGASFYFFIADVIRLFVQNSSDEAARWRPERGYRDKRKERRPYAEYSLPCVFMKSVWSRHLISISTTSIKNDLLALRHSGRAWILQPECSLLYGHNWPCGPFHTHTHTQRNTHTQIGKPQLWRNALEIYGKHEKSISTTRLTQRLWSQAPWKASHFTTQCIFSIKPPAANDWNKQEIQLQITSRNCIIIHTSVHHMPLEVKADLIWILFWGGFLY